MTSEDSLFEEMAVVHDAALRRWARTHAPTDAGDLVQDAFERALRKRPPVQDHDELRAWLFVVARNLMVDRMRGARSRTVFGIELDDFAAPVPEETPAWRCVDWSDVSEALAEIDPRLSEAFVMFARGMSLLQISAATGIPVATVGTRLYRARKRLRTLIEAKMDQRPTAEWPPSRPDRSREPARVAAIEHFVPPHARAASHQHAVL